jgi:hypothetical protein
VRLLINTCIVLSDLGSVEKLSRHLREKKSKFAAVFALELGIPYMVSGDSAAAARAYFETALQNPASREKGWLRWCLAFLLLAKNERDAAKDILTGLARETQEPVLRLLTAYLLDSTGEKADDTRSLIDSARTALLQKGRAAWDAAVRKSRDSIMVIILARLLEKAEAWLFGETT